MSKISTSTEIEELRQSVSHIQLYLRLINSGDHSYYKPLSVELRKLLGRGQGDLLLKRVADNIGVSLLFPIRIAEPAIPPSYRNGALDEYLDEFKFLHAGKEYTRRDILHFTADQRGGACRQRRSAISPSSQTSVRLRRKRQCCTDRY